MKIRVRLTIGEMKPEPRNPTSRYVPTTGIHGAALAYIADNKPFFTYWDVPRMLRDPWIRFLSRVWMSPLRKQTWTVRATSPEVAQTVDRTLRRIWSRAVPTIMREYFAWGFAPGGVEYRVKNDRWVFDSMRRIEPKDARPLVVKDGKNAGDFCGFTLTGLQDQGNCDVFKPYAFWFAGLKKFNNFFDEPPLAGCFDPWSECNTRGGARHLRILWMRKHAIGPAKMYYKPGTTVMVDANGAEVDADNKTLALATLEYLESGGNVAIPSEFDEKGNRLWELETADPKGDIAGVMDYPKELKKEMAEAVGIPFEAIEAAEVGSGWSGRSIPYSTWLGVIDELAGPLVDAIDDAPMRQLVFINHGPRADYEIELISLSKQFEEENKENRPAQVSPGGPPQQPPPQAGPSAPSPGDDGDDPFDVDAFQMSQAGMRVSPEVAGITAENAKKKQNNATRMALLAMLDLQEQAINEGDPGKYQDAMDELAALAHDPEQMRAIAAGEPFDMAWMPYQGPRGGKGYKDDETGRVRYQATKPGERRERQQANAKRASELIQKVRWAENGHEHLQELVDHMPAMTVDKLRYARQMLGAKFGGATKRAAMIEALKAHAVGAMEAGRAEPEATVEPKVNDTQAAKPQEATPPVQNTDFHEQFNTADYVTRRALIEDAQSGKFGDDIRKKVNDAIHAAGGRTSSRHAKILETTKPADAPTSPEPKPEEQPKPTAPVASEERNPVTESAEHVQDAPEDATPREAATAKTSAKDPDYEFARSSSIPNIGEDLKGSARHKRNAWRGLAEAEADGTASEMVKRDTLLKAEPHNLESTLRPTHAISHLASHLALNAFPSEPGEYRGRAKSPPEKLREQYVEAYRRIKDVAEKAANEHTDPRTVTRMIQDESLKLVKKFRGLDENGSHHRGGNDDYNPVANAMAELYSKTGTNYAPRKNDIMGRVRDFAIRVQKAYGNEPTEDMLDKVSQHVQDVMDGDSFNKTFGTTKTNNEFNPATLYVKEARRKGGRAIDAKTVESGTKFVRDNIGMRGLQWGNSVTDDEREHHLQKTAEAFADLADLTGLPDSAMSFGGKLGLAIGARGKGTALAHYEPSTNIINLTRTGGVGSLAHEWGHALDHHITGETERSYMSNNHGYSKHRDTEVGKAMGEVIRSMQESGFYPRLVAVVKDHPRLSDKKKEYWLSGHERFARTFESYASHKLEQDGRENTYLAGANPHEFWPTKEEMETIAPAMDKLMKAIRDTHFADKQ